MTAVFIVCAALGGTVLVMQFLMALIGIGGHAFGGDMPSDIGHGFGGDLHGGDLGGDLHDAGFGDHGGHAGVDHDASAAHHGTDWNCQQELKLW